MYNVDPHGAAVFFLAFALALPLCAIAALAILGRGQDHGDL